MREVVLVMPTQSIAQLREAALLEADLLREFGGFSAYDGQGAWRDDAGVVYVERHTRYHVALGANRTVAVAFLMAHARAAGEQAVYYVDEKGEAHLEGLRGEAA